MCITFNLVSRDYFNNVNYINIMSSSKNCQTYAILKYGNVDYKFCWQSDKIKPIIKQVIDSIYILGVDLNLVIIDLNSSRILLQKKMDLFLSNIFVENKIIYVFTELKIYLIRTMNLFEIYKVIDLPDIYDYHISNGNEINVFCFGGKNVIINKLFN